jgi:hypothetical protein
MVIFIDDPWLMAWQATQFLAKVVSDIFLVFLSVAKGLVQF